MRSYGLIGLMVALMVLAMAAPAAAQSRNTSWVAQDDHCVVSVRELSNDMIQAWVYCATDGFYPAGTAKHIVAIPANVSLPAPWTGPIALDPLPGDGLSGEYWVIENAIAPMAVIARLEGLGNALMWMRQSQVHVRARVAAPNSAQGAGDALSGPEPVRQRNEAAERDRQSGQGDRLQTRDEAQERDQSCADCAAEPTRAQDRQGGNGQASASGSGRRR